MICALYDEFCANAHVRDAQGFIPARIVIRGGCPEGQPMAPAQFPTPPVHFHDDDLLCAAVINAGPSREIRWLAVTSRVALNSRMYVKRVASAITAAYEAGGDLEAVFSTSAETGDHTFKFFRRLHFVPHAVFTAAQSAANKRPEFAGAKRFELQPWSVRSVCLPAADFADDAEAFAADRLWLENTVGAGNAYGPIGAVVGLSELKEKPASMRYAGMGQKVFKELYTNKGPTWTPASQRARLAALRAVPNKPWETKLPSVGMTAGPFDKPVDVTAVKRKAAGGADAGVATKKQKR
jgi:hypothetical protein